MNYLKRIFTAIFTLVIVLTACTHDPKSFEEEVRHTYRDQRGFFFIKIPPALMNLALNIADDPDMSRFFGNARQVGIMSFGDGFPDAKNRELVNDLEQMLIKYDYEELIRITDSDKIIAMKMKENNGKVTELVTIVSQHQGPVMAVTLSGEVDVQQVIMLAADLDFDMLMNLQAMGGRR